VGKSSSSAVLTQLPERFAGEQELVNRILASEQFIRAPRLQRFLTYVTECYFRGCLDEISEQQIGVHVFDKRSDYNPGDDNVVRSYARTLRKRLEEYFEQDGLQETSILEVPRGGYIPVFRPRVAVEERRDDPLPVVPTGDVRAVSSLPPTDHAVDATGLMPGRRNVMLAAFLLIVVGLTGWLSFRARRAGDAKMSTPGVHAFWQEFAGKRNTILVPSDAGLTIVLGLSQRSVGIQDYVTGAYLTDPATRQVLPVGWANPNVHRYTDLIDTKLIGSLSRLPELSSSNLRVQFARDLRADDLKSGNVVLLGGPNANPWVHVFDDHLNFQFEFLPDKRSFRILNRAPRTGELAEYPYGPEIWSSVSYGLIALRSNLSGTGRVLLIEGVAAAGVQGAAEYLLDEDTAKDLMKRIDDGSGHLSDFEMLVKINNVGANATSTEVLGFRKE
jgi:hypothetical protein